MEKIGLAAVLDMTNFDSNMAKYDAALAKMDKTTADAAGKVGQQFVQLGDAVNKVALVVGAAFVAATAAAGAALAKFTSDGIEKAADLESQMGGIAAVMSKTKDEVVPLKDLIKDLALDPKLKVNTTEAADAIEMLGRNGLTMGEIMEGAARSTVLLANATGAQFGTAADIATDVMALFNIEAADMNEAVDGITSVVNNSKFSIDDYRLAIAQGGGVASAVGVTFDDFNATIAATSPLFASGSDAGTSFKTFLQRLVPTTDTASDAMKDLGLFTGMTDKEFEDAIETIGKYEKEMANIDPTSKNAAEKQAGLAEKINVLRASLIAGQNAFFETDGSMKSMSEIAGLLQDAMSGLSDEQRIQTASTIFGTDAMRTAVGMAKVGDEQFLALKATMSNTSAEEAAATRMDNYRGALEILQGVIEAVQISIGEKFLPVLRSLAERLTELVTQNEEKIVAFFAGIADWVEKKVPLAMEWLVNTGLPAMGEAFNYLTDVVFPGIARAIAWAVENWDFLSNAIKVVAGVLATASLVSVFAGIATAIGPLITLITGAGGLVASMVGAGGLTTALLGLLNPVGLVVAAVGGLALAWATDFGGIRTQTALATSAIIYNLSAFGQMVQSNIVTSISNAQIGWSNGWNSIVGKVSATVSTVYSSVATLGNAVQSGLYTAMNSAMITWNNSWSNMSMVVANKAYDIGTAARNAGMNAVNTLRIGWESGTGVFGMAVQRVAGSISGYFAEKTTHWLTAGRSVIEGVSSGISSRASGLYAQMQNVASSVLGSFKAALGIRSPSTEFMSAGFDMATGLSVGVDDGSWMVYDSINSLSSTSLSMLDQTAMQLAERQAQIAQEQMQLRSEMEMENSAFLAQYQQNMAQQAAQNAQAMATVTRFTQAQYAAYWAALQAGQGEAAAIAAGQAVSPTATASTPAAPVTSVPVSTANSAAAQAAAAAMAAQTAQRTETNNAIAAALAPLINSQVVTIEAALQKAQDAINLVVKGNDARINPLDSEISVLKKTISDLNSQVTYSGPGAARDAMAAELAGLRQELIIKENTLANIREGQAETLAPLKKTLQELQSQLQTAKADEARSSGAKLLESLIGVSAGTNVSAAEDALAEAISLRGIAAQEFKDALAALNQAQKEYQDAVNSGASADLIAMFATMQSEARNVKRNKEDTLAYLDYEIQRRRLDVQNEKATGTTNPMTGWGDIQEALRSFVGTTLGGVATDWVRDKMANPAGTPDAINGFVRNLGKLWETATGQVADEFKMLRPLIDDMVTLVNATATTSAESLRDEFDRLLAFRNTVSSAYQSVTGSQLGTVNQTENNTFNVTFQGSNANNQVLQDIQFLNALYATP